MNTSTTKAPSAGRRVVFGYVGDEQLSWARGAFFVPRHYYVMPGILHLAAVLDCSRRRLKIDSIQTRYCNRAVHDFDAMADRLSRGAPHLVGLSCYSWNIEDNLALARTLKQRQPETRIILGGPEVSFENIDEAAHLLEEHDCIDAVVVGEGEPVIERVFEAMFDEDHFAAIPNVVYRREGRIVSSERVELPANLAELPPIDPAAADIPRTPGTGRAVVFQTYRGCPYTCAYCSFHGGACGLRRFPFERVEAELARLFDAEIELINFADAVFDVSRRHAKAILELCLAHNKSSSLLAYVAFQSMDPELAELLERTRIQVGIGLQSAHEDVLHAVQRRFSIPRFFRAVNELQGRRVNYYVDLMFGLPADNLEKFRITFDEVMALRPPFLMPFPLTIIPRSRLHTHTGSYGVVRYDDKTIREHVRPTSGMVYADIGLAEGFDLDDLRRFDDMATAIFFSFQRYPWSLHVISDYARVTAAKRGHGLDAFGVFELMGKRIRERLGGEPIDVTSPPIVEGTVREAFTAALEIMGGTTVEVEALETLLKLEAAVCNLLARPDRRAAHEKFLDRKRRHVDLPRAFTKPEGLTVAAAAPGHVLKSRFAHGDLLRLDELREGITPREGAVLVSAPYGDWAPTVRDLRELEAHLCEEVSSDRELRLPVLMRRLDRRFEKAQWQEALERLVSEGVMTVQEKQGTSGTKGT